MTCEFPVKTTSFDDCRKNFSLARDAVCDINATVTAIDTLVDALLAAGIAIADPTAGSPVSGGSPGVGRVLVDGTGTDFVDNGAVTATAQYNLAIDTLTEVTPAAGDHVAIYDASLTAHRKALISAIVAVAHSHVAADVTDFSTAVIALLTDGNIPNTITLDNITQITTRSHTSLTDIGTTSHADIDTHIAAANPHSGSQPLDATLTALAAYNTNGLIAQTAADTFAGRTITNSDGHITVTQGDGVAGNPTLALPAKHRTRVIAYDAFSPTATDDFVIGGVADAATIVRVTAKTASGTFDFNVEKRGKTTPHATGTNLFAADKQATTTSTDWTSGDFSSAGISADEVLAIAASAIGTSPSRVTIVVEYTID